MKAFTNKRISQLLTPKAAALAIVVTVVGIAVFGVFDEGAGPSDRSGGAHLASETERRAVQSEKTRSKENDAKSGQKGGNTIRR